MIHWWSNHPRVFCLFEHLYYPKSSIIHVKDFQLRSGYLASKDSKFCYIWTANPTTILTRLLCFQWITIRISESRWGGGSEQTGTPTNSSAHYIPVWFDARCGSDAFWSFVMCPWTTSYRLALEERPKIALYPGKCQNDTRTQAAPLNTLGLLETVYHCKTSFTSKRLSQWKNTEQSDGGEELVSPLCLVPKSQSACFIAAARMNGWRKGNFCLKKYSTSIYTALWVCLHHCHDYGGAGYCMATTEECWAAVPSLQPTHEWTEIQSRAHPLQRAVGAEFALTASAHTCSRGNTFNWMI